MRRFLMGPLRDAAGGEGGEGGGGFDPVKFRAEIMADVTKNLNGGLSRIERQLAALKPAAPPPDDTDGGDPPPDPKGGKVDPEIAKLRKLIEKNNADLASEREARSKAELAGLEKERLSLIRTELFKHGLAEHAVDDAFRYFRDEVKRGESGDLVAGADEVPFADFIKATVDKRAHWLPPKQVGGTGATAGNTGRNAGKAFDTSVIRPGMSAEEKAAAYSNIGAIMQARSNQ